MFTGFQSNAFQSSAFQIISGSGITPDTHDGELHGDVRKFWNRERAKSLVKKYKKIVKNEKLLSVDVELPAIEKFIREIPKQNIQLINYDVNGARISLQEFTTAMNKINAMIESYEEDNELLIMLGSIYQ